MNYGKVLLIFSSMLNYYFSIHSDGTEREREKESGWSAMKTVKLWQPYTSHEYKG